MEKPMKSLNGIFAASLAALALGSGLCLAQSYPTKPVRLVVPFPPGGAVDLIARLIQPKMSESLGQTFLIENRQGAAGNVGVEAVARSAPDGYTLVINTNGQAISPAIYKKLNYDAVKDFVPLSQLVASNLILISSPKLPAATVAEFIAIAKAKPGVLNYGGTGVGNPLHLTMELLKLTAGIDIVAVHYQGDAPLFTAMMSGQVEAAVVPLSTALPLVKSGKIRALGMPGAKRVSALPDVPTIAETLPGFESSSWQGLFVPARTPRDAVDALYRGVVKALAAPEVRERLASFNYEVVGSTPEQFKAMFEADVAKFTRIVRDAKIPLQE
jgi:tripartite-type tricarboxylate transporter receptor subunit TctC